MSHPPSSVLNQESSEPAAGRAFELVFSWWNQKEGTRQWATLGFCLGPGVFERLSRIDERAAFGELDALRARQCRRSQAESEKNFESAEPGLLGPAPREILALAISLSRAVARAGAPAPGAWSFSSGEPGDWPERGGAFFEGPAMSPAVAMGAIRAWAALALESSVIMFEESVDDVVRQTQRPAFDAAMSALIERAGLLNATDPRASLPRVAKSL